MNKQDFLAQLRRGLSGLPKEDLGERLTFYSEMIDDRMEDGVPEETAVREIGPVDRLAAQILAEIPSGKQTKETTAPKKKRKVWETVLLAAGSPVWLPLLIAALAVILALYAVLWSVILAFWAVFASVAVCALAGVAAGIYFMISGSVLTGIAVAGAGIVCAGLSVFLFFGCAAASKGVLYLTKVPAVRIRSVFIKKEEA